MKRASSLLDLATTVSIPVRVDSRGALRYLYGGKLPTLKPGTMGDLVVEATDLADPELAKLLNEEVLVSFLPKDTIAFVVVAPSDPLFEGVEFTALTSPGLMQPVVAVTADEDQRLRLRGTKPARLEPATWRIPSLEKAAGSLNEAYRLISEHFERHRRSHTGNVFEEVWYPSGHGWRKLADLRSMAERTNEERLKLPGEGEVIHIYSAPIGHRRRPGPDGGAPERSGELKCQRQSTGLWRVWFELASQTGRQLADETSVNTAVQFKKAFLTCGVDQGASPDLSVLRGKLGEIASEDLLLAHDLEELL